MDGFPFQVPSTSSTTSTTSSTDNVPIVPLYMTPEELAQYDGSDKDKPIYICLLGNVYDVTKAGNFYQPGGPYSVFSGKDATLGLATFNLSQARRRKKRGDEDDENEEMIETGDYTKLSQKRMENAQKWKRLFDQKYPMVGYLMKSTKPAKSNNNGETLSTSQVYVGEAKNKTENQHQGSQSQTGQQYLPPPNKNKTKQNDDDNFLSVVPKPKSDKYGERSCDKGILKSTFCSLL